MRATVMLLQHIGYKEQARKLEMALDICGQYETKVVVTGREDGSTSAEFAEYVMETIQHPRLEEKWEKYQKSLGGI